MFNTEKLTQLTAELEGLLHVLARRDSGSLRTLIRNKYSDFTTEFDNFLDALKKDEPVQMEMNFESAVEDLEQLEVKEQEAVSGEVTDEMTASVEAIERGEEESTEKENEKEAENAGDYTFENDINEFASEPEDVMPKKETVQTAIKSEASTMKVDRMLSRKEASDLKRVFTLNDKFRFRRSLFGQDDAKFAASLEVLSAAKSFKEAKSIVVDDFGWDPANPDVEDFLAIIEPHYD